MPPLSMTNAVVEITVDVPADPQLVPLLRAAGNRPWDVAAVGALADRLEEAGREAEAGWVRANGASNDGGWRLPYWHAVSRLPRRHRQRYLRNWKRQLYGRFGVPLTEIPLCEAADTPAGATPTGG
jgi:hypothetical protein